MRRFAVLVALLVLVIACSPESVATSSTTTTTTVASTTTVAEPLSITSPEFAEGEPIPERFTCDSADINPALEVTGVPATSDMVIVVEDPDAPLGTWIHWLEYDIVAAGPDYVVAEDSGPIGVQGTNSWNLLGYGGPCPPPGETHNYIFKVMLLSEPLGLPEGADYDTVMQAMAGKVIGQTELRGVYGR